MCAPLFPLSCCGIRNSTLLNPRIVLELASRWALRFVATGVCRTRGAKTLKACPKNRNIDYIDYLNWPNLSSTTILPTPLQDKTKGKQTKTNSKQQNIVWNTNANKESPKWKCAKAPKNKLRSEQRRTKERKINQNWKAKLSSKTFWRENPKTVRAELWNQKTYLYQMSCIFKGVSEHHLCKEKLHRFSFRGKANQSSHWQDKTTNIIKQIGSSDCTVN